MPDAVSVAPYHTARQFAPLRWYLGRDLPAPRWAEEQFELEVVFAPSPDPGFEKRSAAATAAMDGLPLQVKDILRGAVDRLVFAPGDEFDIDELGNWQDGEVRINCDWTRIAPLQKHTADTHQGRHLLRTTFVHECGHALVEDPRGGVPLRSFVHLLTISGWLPHPGHDPVPFRGVGLSAEETTVHYLSRLREIDSRWNPELPVRSPQQPPPSCLDRHLMGTREVNPESGSRAVSSLGLRGPRQLACELLEAAAAGSLEAALERAGLRRQTVQEVVQRYRPVSTYAEELIAEVPAEIFRQLHRGPVGWVNAQPAMVAGDRLLIRPWRLAELAMGGREPAHVPALPGRQVSVTR